MSIRTVGVLVLWAACATAQIIPGGGGGSSSPPVPPTPPPVPGYEPSQPLAGCGVEYVSGLTYTGGACLYTINGQTFSAPITSLTLSAADPTNPRIDVIGVNTAGQWFVLAGTPAATPAAPTTDASTELQITLALINANGTTPANVTKTNIYLENTEWTCTPTANFNCASTSNPYQGTKDIEATAAVSGNNVTLVKPMSGTENLSNYNTLTFYIRSKGQWPTSNGSGAQGLRTLSLFWLSGSTQIGTQVVLKDGQFGFVSASTAAYQQISIPVTAFGTGSTTVTTLKAQVSGNGGTSSIGFYIDQITLQGGSPAPVLPSTLMNFRGTYSTSAAYNVNDVVVSGGVGYVALAQNTNVAVSTTSTWASLGGGSSATQTICSGSFALGTSAISSGAAATTVTQTCTGLAATDNIMLDFNASPLGVTGYVPSTTGILTIIKWPTTNTINVSVVNNTGNSITPGAITLNYRVVR